MSAPSYTPILLYGSTTASAVPLAANLTTSASGVELAVNALDGKLFYKDAGGTVQVLGVKMPSGILPIANGGTNSSSTPTAGALAYGTGTAYGFTAAGSSGQVLTSAGSGTPTWTSLSSIGVTTFSAGTTGFTPSTATSGAVTLAGTLATTNGGTGLTSFTANGVVYASSTSALTTGSALTFDGTHLLVGGASAFAKLSVLTSGAGNDVLNLQSSDAEVSTAFRSPTGAFLNVVANTYLRFGVNNSEQMRLTSTGLGIGTSSPGYNLEVDGAVRASIAVRGNYAGGTDIGHLRYLNANGSQVADIYAQNTNGGASDSASLNFSTTNAGTASVKMLLDSSGNLGLGVTPSASTAKTIQIGATYSLGLVGEGDDSSIVTNAYKSSGSWYYQNTATTYKAARYNQFLGSHIWSIAAATGAAGSVITWNQAMTLDASGKLAIGTTNASEYLTVQGSPTTYGDSRFNASLFDPTSATTGTGSGIAFSGWTNGTSTGATFAQIKGIKENSTAGNTAGAFVISTLPNGGAPTERARIDSSGNFGLGVTPSAWVSPALPAFDIGITGGIAGQTNAANLHITANAYLGSGPAWKYKTSNYAGRFTVGNDSGTGGFSWYTAPSGTAGNPITFTQAMTLDASGNLLVGSTSINSGVAGIQVGSGKQIVFDNGNANLISNLDVPVIYGSGSGGSFGFNGHLVLQPRGSAAGAIIMATGSGAGAMAERARIDSSGNLLVGTTNTVIWNTTNTGVVIGGSSGPAIQISRSADVTLLVNRTSTDGKIQIFARQGTEVGSVSVTTTATAYNTSSDYRLKNITGPITNSGAYIDSLNPVEGTWKADGSTFVGLIAHEVQEVSRTNVATGVKDGPEMQGMDYSSAEIIANLIAEVKSLRARLAALEAK